MSRPRTAPEGYTQTYWFGSRHLDLIEENLQGIPGTQSPLPYHNYIRNLCRRALYEANIPLPRPYRVTHRYGAKTRHVALTPIARRYCTWTPDLRAKFWRDKPSDLEMEEWIAALVEDGLVG